jgi:hypothetical protein
LSVFNVRDSLVVQLSDNESFALPTLQKLVMFKLAGGEITPMTRPWLVTSITFSVIASS